MLSVDKLERILEAALFAASSPLSREQLAALFEDGERPSAATLTKVLTALQESYAGRGVELVEVAGGWRFQVPPTFAPWVSRLWDERPARYSRALLETLALIAYRQPITRAEIEEVRGVAVSTNIIRTLEERQWVRVLGHREVPGRPALFGTTRAFLDYFSLKSLNQLPTLAEIRDLDEVARDFEKTVAAAASSDGSGDGSGDGADNHSGDPSDSVDTPVETDLPPAG